MRLTTIFLFATCLQVAAASSAQTVTINVKHASAAQVFREIQKQTKLNVMIDVSLLEEVGDLDLNFKHAPIRQVLDKCFEGLPITYTISGNTIVVRSSARKGTDDQQRDKEILIVITGKVTDEEGNPLARVSVYNVNTKTGTITSESGEFELKVSVHDTIRVTYVGYLAQSVIIKPNTSNLKIKLVPSVRKSEEVVVTGYQTIRKSEMVGSASTVKREDLFYDGTNTIEQMLQGKLPGTLVINNSGLVGTRQKVRVRGTSTLLGNQEPVWVVDGIIQEDPIPFKAQELDAYGNITQDNFDMVRTFIGNSISWLNPNDIEDITVLKDASATVLYGVKAANGVIMITTKKGKSGRVSVNYYGGAALSNRLAYDKMNLMNSKERIDVSREIYNKRLYGLRYTDRVGYENAIRRYLDKEISYAQFDEEVKRLETVNTDWFGLLFQQPVSFNHSINASGGSEAIRYYASLSTNKVNGTAKGNESESNSSSINLDARLNKKITLSVKLNGSMSKTKGFYQADPYTYASTTSRAIPAFYDDGSLFYYGNRATNSTRTFNYNILNELANTGNENNTRSFNTYVNFKYDLLNGLRFESILGIASSNTTGQSFATEHSYYIAKYFRSFEYGQYVPGDIEYKASWLPHGGELNTTNSRTKSITWRNSLSYNQLFGKHRLGLLLGQESRSTKMDGELSTVYGYFPDRGKNITFPPPAITNLNGVVVPNSLYQGSFKSQITDRKSNFLSLYSSGTYSYDEKYVVTGSIRMDASNRFGQDTRHRFLPVWSAGVRWNVHNEEWMKNQNLISELNLRGTYGWQGNVAENFGPDLIAQIPYVPIEYYTGEFSLQIKSLPYADLRWEKTKTLNAGLDLGIFKNRFILSAEYYRKKSVDVIIYKEVPVEYGVTTMPVNGGNLLNQGVEIQLSGTIVRAKNWMWNLSVNTSKNINKVESDFPTATWWMGAVNGTLIKQGYPVSSFWAFRYKGPNPQTGFPEYDIPTAGENPKAMTDVTQYMKYMGKLEPDFSGGISTVVRYKTFSLMSSFNLNIGGKKFLYKMFTSSMASNLPTAYDNLPQEFVNRWRKPGDEKHTSIPSIPTLGANGSQVVIKYPSGYTGYIWDMYNYSDDRVVDASFLRCNNISFSYGFPEELLKPWSVKSLTFSVSVSNPFTIVSKELKRMDPEVATGNQPLPSTWSFGINLSF